MKPRLQRASLPSDAPPARQTSQPAAPAGLGPYRTDTRSGTALSCPHVRHEAYPRQLRPGQPHVVSRKRRRARPSKGVLRRVRPAGPSARKPDRVTRPQPNRYVGHPDFATAKRSHHCGGGLIVSGVLAILAAMEVRAGHDEHRQPGAPPTRTARHRPARPLLPLSTPLPHQGRLQTAKPNQMRLGQGRRQTQSDTTSRTSAKPRPADGPGDHR